MAYKNQLPPKIKAIDLHRSYEIGDRTLEVLKGVTLTIEPSEKVFMLGPSGAGKTTLLYTLGGMESPESGDVLVGEDSLYEKSRSARATLRNELMGFVFQGYQLLPELSAIENVALPSMIGGKKKKERALELLEQVGLAERVNHLPAELSGGEQQRAAIARALMNNPPILFADEPTGNLDSETGQEVMNLLMSLVKEHNKTLIVVTHDQKLAKMGDRVVTITDGVIQ